LDIYFGLSGAHDVSGSASKVELMVRHHETHFARFPLRIVLVELGDGRKFSLESSTTSQSQSEPSFSSFVSGVLKIRVS